MEGECCTAGVSSSSSSLSTSSAEQKRKQRQLLRELKPYRGIRMRKWGKWVAEIREPNKRSRIWLGSYVTPVAAARAYDTAVFYLRGPSARLNFPELIFRDEQPQDLSAATIRKIATEVGARVDAVQRALLSSTSVSTQLPEKPDLNLFPSPETSDED